MPPRQRGRPRKVYVVRGRAAANLRDAPSSLPTVEATPATDDPSLGVIVSGAAAQHALLASQTFGVPPPTASGPTGSTSPFLDHITHDRTWKCIASIPLIHLPFWFDDHNNDFNHYKLSSTLSSIITWIRHPGDSPNDPRTRTRGIKEKRVLVRWDLRCAGAHDRACDTEDMEEDNPITPEDGAVAQQGEEASAVPQQEDGEPELAPEHRERWYECRLVNPVKIHCEVLCDDLTVVHIWQRYEHVEAIPGQLGWSKFMRSLILERMHLGGAKATTIIPEVVMTYRKDTVDGFPPLPVWQRPTSHQVRNMSSPAKHRLRLHWNPFKATDLLVALNPSKIFEYTRHDFKGPDDKSDFSIGLTDDFSLDSLIAHAPENGAGLDQSWHNKSENRAALSVLCTVNEGRHMVPGAMFVSANAKEKTVLKFLIGVHKKVLERARAIVNDPTVIQDRTPQMRRKIRESAVFIILNGVISGRWMIDKSRPNLNAILKYLLKYKLTHLVYIRICQFHIVVEAILRWDCDSGQHGLGFTLGLEIKFQILLHFRELQRCRLWSDWELTKKTFFDAIRKLFMEDLETGDEDDIVDEGDDANDEEDAEAVKDRKKRPSKSQPDVVDEQNAGDEQDAEEATNGKKRARKRRPKTREVLEAQYAVVHDYFETNWFTNVWIDIGLPPNQTRDGTWNTNNWSESAFRTFDQVFLDNRQNKRIDRLASIILNDFLPFYRYWNPVDRNPPREFVDLHMQAHTLGESGMVSAVGKDIFEVDIVVDGVVSKFRVTMNPIQCVCVPFKQSGKYCLHLLAVRLLLSNGSAERWKGDLIHPFQNLEEPDALLAVEYEIESNFSGKAHLTGLGSQKQKKLRSDAAVQKDLDRLLVKMAAEDAKKIADDDLHLFERPGKSSRRLPG
ncbi:hypothetical protein C8J57DRAFT_1258304 [Mycena rebaudengoi]|nr:hypothetical protein C8J57DRAFT_1258304 [Mycena rebaudengoi]